MSNKKDTLVIVPGFAGNKKTWKKFTTKAKPFFHTVVIELPCFGNNPCPDETWTLLKYVQYVENKIKELKIQNPVLIGHSFGGTINAIIVAEKRLPIKKLILIAPTIIKPRTKIRKLGHFIIRITGPIFFKIPIIERLDLLFKQIFSLNIVGKSINKTQTFNQFTKPYFEKYLKKIEVQTKIIWGGIDIFVPVTDAFLIEKKIKNSSLDIIYTGGHVLNIYKTNKLLEIVKQFICE
jgi:pimeloyl-ACP methyl ester carboxylesterase